MTTTKKRTTKKPVKKTYVKKDLYQEITNKFISMIEDNKTLPWVKPFSKGAQNEGTSALPSNGISGNNYRGINTMLLMGEQYEKGYRSNTWLTYKQAADLKGNVIKGQKGSQVIYFQMLDKKDDNGEITGKIPMMKSFTVFNAEQCENLDTEKFKLPVKREITYTTGLQFALDCGADVQHSTDDRAFYSPSKDFIMMPYVDQFTNEENYDSTLLHELSHWSGNKKRLERGMKGTFGSPEYALEELCAEQSSAYLASQLGLDHTELHHNTAAYLESWLKALKNDKKFIFKAAKQACAASDYLLDLAESKQAFDSQDKAA